MRWAVSPSRTRSRARPLYQRLSGTRRADLHGRVGRAIEQRHGDAADHLPALARHHDLAGDRAGALRYHLLAGDAAASIHGADDALHHYSRAIEAAGALGLGPDDARVYGVHHRRALLRQRAGDLAGAVEDAEAALAGARAAGDAVAELDALNRRAFMRRFQRVEDAVAWHEEALRAARGQRRRASAGGDAGPARHRPVEPAAPRRGDAAGRAGARGRRTRGRRRGARARPRRGQAHRAATRGSPHAGRCDLPPARPPRPGGRRLEPALAGRLGAARARLRRHRDGELGGRARRRRERAGRQPAAPRPVRRADVPRRPHLDPSQPRRSRGGDRTGHRGRRSRAGASPARNGSPSTSASLGWALLEAGDPAGAAAQLEPALAAAERVGARAQLLRCTALLAWAASDLGDQERAIGLADQAEEVLATVTTPPGRMFLLGAHAPLAVARVRLACGEATHAIALVEPVLEAARAAGWRETVAYATLLAGAARGDRATVEQALALARRDGLGWVARESRRRSRADRGSGLACAARWPRSGRRTDRRGGR